MANKRMFTKQITESDAFLDMPGTSQNLYFHLNMNADDDGFVNAPNRIMRSVGANKNDMDVLISKKFILIFDNGVIVIKHWRIHNILRSDRYKETVYKDEKSILTFDENGSYTMLESPPLLECIPSGNQLETNGIQLGTSDKNRLDKISIDKSSSSNNTEVLHHAKAETAETASANNQKDLKKIIKVYEEEIGLITPMIAEDIELFLKELPADMITRAIVEASSHNVKAWVYIRSILNRCVNQGIKNINDFETNKKKSKSVKKEPSSKPGKYDGVYQN